MIDSKIKPNSFTIKDKKLKITETVKTEEITLNNIAAYMRAVTCTEE